MRYREMGKTGVEVSVLGFGCMRFPTIEGEDSRIDEEKSIEMIRHAIDNGVNYLDTAFFYHSGNSERLVGKALKDGYRKLTYLATKLPLGSVNCEEDVEKLFNEQLEKLDTDYIDFYLLHAVNDDSWENKVVKFDILSKLEKLKEQGKIKHLGFSFHDDLWVFKKIIDAYDGFEFCQIQLNYIDVDYQAGIEGLEYAASKGLGVIVMEPLLGGKLANPNEKVLQKLSSDKTPVEWAFDFLWNRPEVSMLLSGMGTMQMVTDNLGYADKATVGMLSEENLAMLAQAKKAFDELNLVPCTGCEYCMPCPAGVEIPKVFSAFNNITTGGRRLVKEIFPDIEANASLCKKCGKCESACPQHIEIAEMLRKVKNSF
ncbi:MAG: aldo/keto reductase [Ruminococcaceae bacterium]|nr:aldo/keto reductase [Oscillospiraceae bacterium]